MEPTKSFWDRPEGFTGKLFGLGIAGLIGYGLYKFLPFLITIMENTLYSIFLGVALVAVITVLLNGTFQTAVWYLFSSLMRGLTGIMIEMNPIAILRGYIVDIKEKMSQMQDQLVQLRGQIGIIDKKISTRKDEMEKSLRMVQAAQSMPDRQADVRLYTTNATRLQEYINKMIVLSDKMKLIQEVLKKMALYSEIMIKNTEFEVEIRSDEYESVRKSHSIMKSAMSIINGNLDKRAIFEQAMNFVVDDIGYKMGEMDRMLEASSDFISSVDIEDAAYADKGLLLLKQFDERGLETIFGDRKTPKSFTPNQNIIDTKPFRYLD